MFRGGADGFAKKQHCRAAALLFTPAKAGVVADERHLLATVDCWLGVSRELGMEKEDVVGFQG